MEYIKKEELIIGEIYKSNKYNHIFKYQSINGNTNINISCNYRHFSRDSATIGQGLNNITNATPEEKHWLNECIKLDKFITFEEAIKTFIPEYVECIEEEKQYGFYGDLGKIYKVDNWNHSQNDCMLIRTTSGSTCKNRFKPSTKEAYDAQFVVKEPEFVLPEKWAIKFNSKWDILSKFKPFNNNYSGNANFNSFYKYNLITQTTSCSYNLDNYTELTLEQFKKYILKEETVVKEKVIEPLPQFKVIETIETITKVENNEGNQFFIGDVVKTIADNIYTIKSFEYNVDKSNILAMTDKNTLISIDNIEHYIEPKTDYKILEYKTEGGISCKAPFLADSHQFYINERCKIYSIKRISDDLIITVGDDVLSKTCGVPNKILSIELINNKIRLYPRNSFYNLEDIIKVKDETLLEKAKRLYPVGTKFIPVMRSYNTPDISTGEFRENGGDIFHRKDGVSIFFQNKWAEIIK